jgi:hypothetical protein
MRGSNLIDRIVSETLEDRLSNNALTAFVANTSIYDEDFNAAEIGVF